MNLAVEPDLPFWLVCPYDADLLGDELLADAGRSHPVLATPSSVRGQRRLPRPGPRAGAVRRRPARILRAPDAEARGCRAHARPGRGAGDPGRRVGPDVRPRRGAHRGRPRVVVDSVRRGADTARLRLWDQPAEIVCEITDRTVVGDLLAGRRAPTSGRIDPVWWANQTCDLVQLRSNLRGTTVRLRVSK